MSTHQWNSQLYDTRHGFVAKFGEGVVELLHPQPNERILDLGCGTGTLTRKIAESGAKVVGVDQSAEMIATAKSQFPNLPFYIESVTSLPFENEFDAVFSNAVLHWIKTPDVAVQNIAKVLKHGGRFVTEFGGWKNVDTLMQAIRKVLDEKNLSFDQRTPWYFPKLGEYCSLLESQGFGVEKAFWFERPTLLCEGEAGIKNWLDMFCGPFFEGFSTQEYEKAVKSIEDNLRPTQFSNGSWCLDYARLRIEAVKL